MMYTESEYVACIYICTYRCVYIYKSFEIYRQFMYKLHIQKFYIPYVQIWKSILIWRNLNQTMLEYVSFEKLKNVYILYTSTSQNFILNFYIHIISHFLIS